MRFIVLVFYLLGNLGDICAQQCSPGFFQETLTDVPIMGTTYFGGGVSTYDIDEDGWDDLTVGISGSGYFVFRNVNGSLELWWNFQSDDDVKQCLWGDLNNDGFNDFIGLTLQGEILLYQNVGNEYFINVGQGLNQQLPNRIWMGASLGDMNRDGWLDLYLCAYDEGVNVLLRNLSFMNGEVLLNWDNNAMLTGTAKSSFQPIWIDLNNDDFSDLFVVNDFNQGNDYYESNPPIGFQKKDELNQLNFPVQCMSNAWSDFDLDGDLDVMITDTARTYLLENNEGIFLPLYDDAFVPFWTWSALWMDADNDFYDDILVTGNNVVTNEGAVYYFDNTAGQFDECPVPSFTSARYFAASKWDIENDLFYDAVLAPDSGFHPLLLHNLSYGASAIKVHFEGTWSNRNGVGVKYNSYSNGMRKHGQVFSGENYLSQNSQNLILPVSNNYNQVDSLRIQWPSGISETWYNLEVGQSFFIQEGSSALYPDSLQFVFCPGDSIYLSLPNLLLSVNPDFGFSDTLLFFEEGDYLIHTRGEFGLTRSMYVSVMQSNYSFDFQWLDFNCSDSATAVLYCLDVDQNEIDSIYFLGPPSMTEDVILISPDGCSSQNAIGNIDFFQPPFFSGILDTVCWNDTIFLADVFLTTDSGAWWVNGQQSESLFAGSNAIIFESSNGCQWDTIIDIHTYPIVVPEVTAFIGDTCTWFFIAQLGFSDIIWNNQWNLDTLCLSDFSGELHYTAMDQWSCMTEGDFFVQPVFIENDVQRDICLSRDIWDLQGRCLASYLDCSFPLLNNTNCIKGQLVLVRDRYKSGDRTYLMQLLD